MNRERVARALHALSPWGGEETLRVIAFFGVGLVLVVVGWWGGARQAAFAKQVSWINVAVIGFVVAAAGELTWLRRGRTTIRERRRTLLPDIERAFADEPSVAAQKVVAGSGLDRFHRPECPLAAGRAWRAIDRDRAERKGQQPCGVCRP